MLVQGGGAGSTEDVQYDVRDLRADRTSAADTAGQSP